MAEITFARQNVETNVNINGGASALQWGPDGLLYVLGRNGNVYAFDVSRQTKIENGVEVTDKYVATQVWTHDLGTANFGDFGDTDGEKNADGSFDPVSQTQRQALGLVVTEEAGETVVYVSHSDIVIGAGSGGGEGDKNLDTNSGVVTRIKLDVNGTSVTETDSIDLIRGLPRSEENHATNGLQLYTDPQTGKQMLLIAQGGHTNAGSPSTNFVGLPEYAYSAAILSADLDALATIEAARRAADPNIDYVFDLPTLDDPTRPNFKTAQGADIWLDANFDGQVDSVAEFVDRKTNGTGALNPDGLPDWLKNQDGDGDVDAADLAQFVATKIVDVDGDGVKDTIHDQVGGSKLDNVTGVRGGNDGLNQAKLMVGNPVQVFSGGYRNPYDVLVAENGQVYTYDNGANNNWGGPPVGEQDVNPNNPPADTNVTNQPNTNQGGTNNFDQLHVVTKGFHGGHPNPTLARGAAAGWWTSPTSFIADARQLSNTPLPDNGMPDSGLVLPADWNQVVAQSLKKIVSSDYREGGTVQDGALDTDQGSWNGIAEYTGTAFDGELKGAILVTGTHGEVKYIQRDPVTGAIQTTTFVQSGKTFVQAANQGTVGLKEGSNTLGIDAVGDGGVDGNGTFNNTIWVTSLGGTFKIQVFEAGGTTTGPDTDKDNDGRNHVVDLWDFSATQGINHDLGGMTTTVGGGVTKTYELSAAEFDLSGYGGIGLLGGMTNGVDPFAPGGLVSALANVIFGGAGSGMQVKDIRDGTALGAANDQKDAFIWAADIGDDVGTVEVSAVMNSISASFYQDGSSAGLQAGTGTQSSFVAIALSMEGTTASIEVTYEEANVQKATSEIDISHLLVNGMLPSSTVITFTLAANLATGVLTPSFAINGGAMQSLTPFTLEGATLAAFRGDLLVGGVPHALAFGNIGTSQVPETATNVDPADKVSVTYDRFVVKGVSEGSPTPPTVAVLDPLGGEEFFLSADDRLIVVARVVDANGVNLSSIAADDLAVTVNGVAVAASRISLLQLEEAGASTAIKAPFTAADGSVYVTWAVAPPAGGWATGAAGQSNQIDVVATVKAGSILDLAGAANAAANHAFSVDALNSGTDVRFAVNAGNAASTITYDGNAYVKDSSHVNVSFTSSSGVYSDSEAIFGAPAIANGLYKTERYGVVNATTNPSGQLAYSMTNLEAGTYAVEIGFAEIFVKAATTFATAIDGFGGRTFDLSIEGTEVLTDFDQFKLAPGGLTALDRTFVTTVTDGALDLVFSKGVENPDVKFIKVSKLPATLDPGAATLAINETSNNIEQSNFGAGSFVLTNVGGKKITKVEIDVSDALYPDSVFDPFGKAGDTVSKVLTIDSAGGTGVVAPNNNENDPNNGTYVGAGGIAGYEGIVLNFTDFQPNETVTFSVDMDPNSVAGAVKSTLDSGAILQGAGSDNKWDVGGVSGAELIGSRFIVTYEDGTTSTGELTGAGNNAGSRGLSSQAGASLGVTLKVNGLDEGDVGTYGSGGLNVTVSGPAGETARITLSKGFIVPFENNFTGPYAAQLDQQLAALAGQPFPANNAVQFYTVDVLLNGSVQNISNLFDSSTNGGAFNLFDVPGFSFAGENQLPIGVVATIVDPQAGNLPKGPVSAPIYLEFDGGPANEPPAFTSPSAFSMPENQTAVATVAANDPDNDTLTYAIAAGLDGGLFNINGSTGALSFKTAPDFEAPTDGNGNNVYQLNITASDGVNPAVTQALSVTVTDVNENPGGPPIIVGIYNTAGADTLLAQLDDGDVFTTSQLPGSTLSLSAEVVDGGALDGLVGSLKLKLVGGGQTYLKTENIAPYALFGDNNGDLTGGVPLGPGTYQFEVQAFSGSNGNGTLHNTFVYDFEVQGGPTLPTASISVAPVSGSEAGGTQLAVTVTTSSAVSGNQTVALALGGTGLTASDFVGTIPSNLTIANGTTSASVILSVADDASAEGTETASFTISNPSAGLALGATKTASFAITDNDAAPSPITVGIYNTAGTDTLLAQLDDGDVFTTSQLSGSTLSLSAGVVAGGALDGLVGSVKLTLVGGGQSYLKTENIAPYALFGDNSGNLTGGVPLGPGTYQFEVQAFSGSNGKGTLHDTFVYDFEVQSGAAAASASELLL